MNPIRNLKIRDQLLILLFLLLIPLVYFVVVQLRAGIAEQEEYREVITQLTESDKISDFIHQLQKERAGVMAATDGDSLFLLEAISQRSLTDAAQKDLQLFLESTNRSFSGISLINDLSRYRYQLDEARIDPLEFRGYSQSLIYTFLNRIDENATGISNVVISRELQSFKNLVEAKVQLGRVRSLMMRILLNEELSFGEYAQFQSQKDAHQQAISNFKRYATEVALQDVQNQLSTDSYKEIVAVFQQLAQNPRTDLSRYNTLSIYNLFTKSVEDLRAAEDRMIFRIKQRVQEESVEQSQNLIVLGTLMFLALLLAGLLSIYIINLISSSLSSLKTAADRIILGATDVVIDINSRNEIGVVANSFRGVVKKNLELTKVAQAIGNGIYDIDVVVQSPEDKLSLAIQDMKDNLSLYNIESRNRSWILGGISELNNLLYGETNVAQLSEKIIAFLCEYTGSEAGIFYGHDNAGKLNPLAAYGVEQSTEQLTSFAVGAGQVGQAVSEQKVKILEAVPEEYLKIKSGLSEISPANIVIIPLYFSDTIVGAVELCTRQPYNDLQQEFFKAAGERISIIIQTLQAHFKTQELLYETQNQAEELETQQEELRELNAELKASEEELKVSQEELQEKNAELEEKAQLLEEQYEALRSKNNALEDAREAIELKIKQVEEVSRYKSEFLANMSHELRTPLNSILILSRLLADNPEENLTQKQGEHARIIHKSGADLLKLINEILDLSKIESGMIKLEVEALELSDLDLESTFKALALNKKIDFKVQLDTEGLNTIYTDRFRLEQILKNFLSNAIKFTPAGGEVGLAIRKLKGGAEFRSEQLKESEGVVAFTVKDNGIGIPKEKQQAIFEAFQQADSSTTRKFGGTGLGLAISKELATLLGGEIGLESEEGKGSTFTLYVPAKPQQETKQGTENKPTPPAEPPVPAPVQAPATKKTSSVNATFDKLAEDNGKKEISVLIIEDDKGFNDILADFALAKNFKVRQSFTGSEGLELARKIKPDAVMLDIHLPDISGWDVLKEIREDKELRHINVHIMSAYDKEVADKQRENEEYLPKPVTLEMLNTAFTTISAISDSSIETILIVEDNEVENKAIAELLLAHSLQSLSAYSAEEAEQLLAKNKIDCIILDLNLPGMKGYEWMEKIKSTKGLTEIPIIIYSGKDLSEEEEIKLKKFANTVIIKNEYSYLRLLDEVQLFLHKVNQKLPLGNEFKMKLHVPEEILQNKKVLLVDDDVRNVYSLSNLLELQGMQIVEAYNGKEALAKLRSEEGIDMVLMDVMMPEMDGMEATRQIRKMEQYKDLPVIALTAKAMKEDREKCIAAGASDYIPKPVDTDKLLTLMRIWLYEA
jgi:CheY-like chemotaxis protein/signal transduction histidine kinase/HAMP domain-containing protein